MKIIHICLASHYTEGMSYQDNLLPEQNAYDGNNVIVVSDCYKFNGSQLVKVHEEDKVLKSGVRLVRMEYDKVINTFITSKVRKVSKLYHFLDFEKPDVILFHGAAGYEMLNVAKYKKNNKNTKLYVDSHIDYNNSAKLKISLYIQYRLFNRLIIYKVKKYIEKFLFVSFECKVFLMNVYGLTERELEFYPLGGKIINRHDKNLLSKKVRGREGYQPDDIVIVHSGKLVSAKKTKELIEAFHSVQSNKLKLIIIGHIPKEQIGVLEPLIVKDKRINFVGWKDTDELTEYLCAADMYFQPGTQSATMQHAICCGLPIALFPYESHRHYLDGNGFFVTTVNDYRLVFKNILENPESLKNMSESSYKLAYSLLDYKILAARLYK